MTRRSRRTTIGLVAVALLTVGALASATYGTVIRPAYERDGLLVVLVVGSDVGVPYRPGDPLHGRADAIHVVAVDADQRLATVVDIPRDSLVGGRKVNAHMATGGPEALVSQLEAFTGLTFDYWMLTTFLGFEDLTRAIGGVDVVVEVPMHDASSQSDFEPGPAHLEGGSALAFARDRHSLPDGDFGRTRHQGDLLLAIHRRLADGHEIGELVDLVATVARTTVSNVPPSDLLPLALLANDIDPDDVAHISLTGRVGTQGGASVVRLEQGDVFADIAAGVVGPGEHPSE